MKRAIVTGAAGHLGLELVRQLQAAEFEVHALVRVGTKTDALQAMAVHLHPLDGTTERVVEICQQVKPDTVFHVASLYCRDHKTADITPLVESNILYGSQLLEGMRLSGCHRMVTAGTFFQHYNTDDYRALNLYAASKQAFDDILAYYADAYSMSAATLILYEIYSEHDVRRKLMTVIGDSCAQGNPVNLPSDEFWVNFVHVEDVAAAFLQAARLMEAGDIPAGQHRTFSVCAEQDTSSADLVAQFQQATGAEITVNRGAFTQPPRHMPIPWRGDALPGWSPKIDLATGIGRLLAQRQGR
jgi:nucleoside-diphosphate-sugar epimerase